MSARRLPGGRKELWEAEEGISMNDVMYSSATDEWATPRALFQGLDALYHFETDVCATDKNALCDNYFTKEEDGLSQEWRGVCWMNPPYGKQIGLWMEKAYTSSLHGATVVCLVPARTDTAWWNNYARKGKVYFIRGRLKFNGSKDNAPFPSAIVVFGEDGKS